MMNGLDCALSAILNLRAQNVLSSITAAESCKLGAR